MDYGVLKKHENNTKHIAVTGINGFVGQHLAKELSSHNIKTIGIGHVTEPKSHLDNLLTNYKSEDLTQGWPNVGAVDAIIHLAGLAAVGPSFEHPQSYIEANSAMLTHMCEHYLKSSAKPPRIVVISSGAVYGSNQTMPLNEDSSIDFSSPYVVSKILVENQVDYYRKRGLDCVVVRPFNHIGPGQKGGFLLPDLYTQLKSAKQGTIKVGNLETRRDYTDVRDVVRAYRLIATDGNLSSNIYNLCSGTSVSGKEILHQLEVIMSLSNIKTKVDKSRFRPNDAKEIYGDYTKLKNDTGWQPQIRLEQTIADFVFENPVT